MDWIVLIAASFATGFAAAIPVGATHIEIAKRSIVLRIKSAFMIILGALISDLIYGFVAMYGIAPFLQDKYVEAFFWLIGAVVLIILGVFTIIYSDKVNEGRDRPLFKSNFSLIVGFTINTVNPSMIFWWLFCFELFKNIGIVHTATLSVKTAFVVSGIAGMGAYYSLFVIFLKKVGSTGIIRKYESKINKVFGALLISLSIYFIYKAIEIGCLLKL